MSDAKEHSAASEDEAFGREIYGPGKQYFDDVVVDNILEALLELTATVWTYRDRSLVLEQVLQELVGKEHGVKLEELVEAYRPSEAVNERRKQEREEMINRVFDAFARRPV